MHALLYYFEIFCAHMEINESECSEGRQKTGSKAGACIRELNKLNRAIKRTEQLRIAPYAEEMLVTFSIF